MGACVRAALLCLGLLALCEAGTWRRAIDWPQIEPELLGYFRALVQIDTTNPPGNETRVVNYLRPILEREGISCQVFALEKNRANLVARLKGNGSKRPLIIMGHTDVVGVDRARWKFDPFGATLREGFVIGRGTVDDKSHVAAGLMTVLLLKRTGAPLDRDVIFIAEAGEEGTTRFGIDFLVAEHWNEIAAEYALAEGGETAARNGTVRYSEITTTEKVVRRTRLIAHGMAGHGSQPRLDNAITHLAAALVKVTQWQTPARLNETTRIYFQRLARISPPEEAWRYQHLADADKGPAIQRYFAEHELEHYSILRTSISPTVIRGGFRNNVIPSEAEAELDIRALPDEDMPRFYAQLRRVIDDPSIEVAPSADALRPAAPASRLDTDMFHALEHAQQRMWPGAITLPAMVTGATDLAQLRAKGVQAYGFGPVVDEQGRDGGGGPHSDDERLRESSLYEMTRFLWSAVTEVAVSPMLTSTK
jgi:acetylornithine deacetylase/succinyl-diaminopimelate desuccinylase-like protein